jgi:hypothetical protein
VGDIVKSLRAVVVIFGGGLGVNWYFISTMDSDDAFEINASLKS